LILFVVNENSGNGRGRTTWDKVEKALRARGVAYERISTRSEEEAVRLVGNRMAQGDLKAVSVVGGDGTLHGLLPLLASSGMPCGLIPSGSGNDTSRALGLARDPLRALDAVLGGRTRRVDLLETVAANGGRQTTLTAVAVGLDAAVAADVNAGGYKRWCNKLGLGSLAYVIGLLRTLVRFRPRPIAVTVDGTSIRYERAWLSAVSNVSTYGGGLRISPSALPDDGRLHVCVVHSCSALRLLLIFPTVLAGKHVRWTRYVSLRSGRDVAIETVAGAEPFFAFGDGEPSGASPIRAAIRPAQLDFLISASG